VTLAKSTLLKDEIEDSSVLKLTPNLVLGWNIGVFLSTTLVSLRLIF